MSCLFSHVDTMIFGGGGVKSVAYLGALEELCSMGMDWTSFCNQLKIVAGASAGSFSAAMVALGVSIVDLNERMREFDSSILFREGLATTMLKGMQTVFSCPDYGIIPWENLQDLYDSILETSGFVRGGTLSQFTQMTGKRLDIYVTNISCKTIEMWNYENHPEMPVSFALTASSAIPLVITTPNVAGYMYADGGIMLNVPLSQRYDSRRSLVMMLDIEPQGDTMESRPPWFGHYLSRVFDCMYESQRMIHQEYDPLWELNTVRIKCDSITLLDTFSSNKLSLEMMKRGKQDGVMSMRGFVARLIVLMSWVLQGIQSVGNDK